MTSPLDKHVQLRRLPVQRATRSLGLHLPDLPEQTGRGLRIWVVDRSRLMILHGR